jgi:hypothetical protein
MPVRCVPLAPAAGCVGVAAQPGGAGISGWHRQGGQGGSCGEAADWLRGWSQQWRGGGSAMRSGQWWDAARPTVHWLASHRAAGGRQFADRYGSRSPRQPNRFRRASCLRQPSYRPHSGVLLPAVQLKAPIRLGTVNCFTSAEIIALKQLRLRKTVQMAIKRRRVIRKCCSHRQTLPRVQSLRTISLRITTGAPRYVLTPGQASYSTTPGLHCQPPAPKFKSRPERLTVRPI